MDSYSATLAFAALGHPGRLAVFRLLMRFAPRGVRPSDMAKALDMKPNTLSHHLADLAGVGLVTVERQGRNLLYAVDMAMTESLIGYLALDLGRARPQLLASLGAQPKDRIMSDKTFNVLFICSGNSARSIFAEAILRDLGRGRFNAFSAGTNPGSQLNPFALQVLERNEHDITPLRAKHVGEFQNEGAPEMDFVFTVCDQAANEECPAWEGQPISGHWGMEDPVKVTGTDAEKSLAFQQAYGALRRRIEAFTALPVESLDRIALQSAVDDIGRAGTETTA